MRLALLLLAFVASPTATVGGQQGAATDYVFLVDVSGSMAGKAGGVNIFPGVQKAISDFVAQVTPGSRVFVLPFEARIRETRRFQIQSAADIRDAQNYIRSLVADGNNTAIYNSLNAATALIAQERGADQRPAMFFIYTDGSDNVSSGWTLATILDHFRLKRGDQDWLFYTELGLPPDPKKERTFAGQERMRYAREQTGQMHPIVQIEPLVPILNFGNMKGSPMATRIERFAVRGSAGLPPGVTLSAEPDFPTLRALGALPQFGPKAFAPGDSVPLRLSLLNAEGIPDGEYAGSFRLTASDPLVLIVPGSIAVRFSLEAPRTLRISSVGELSEPLAFGRLESYRNRSAEEVRREFNLEFSASAIRARESVPFSIKDDAKNPTAIAGHVALLVDGVSPRDGSVAAGAKRLTVVLKADSTLAAGHYSGAIHFLPRTIAVSGTAVSAPDNGVQVMPWSLTIDRAPRPAWVWALIALALAVLAALLIRYATKPPLIGDLRLEVLDPERRTIELSRLHVMSFGPGKDELLDSKTVFAIRAKKAGRAPVAVLELHSGVLHLKQAGSRSEEAVIGGEQLCDGDMLRFGDYKVRVASFSYVRE
jgi:hypothetical protein